MHHIYLYFLEVLYRLNDVLYDLIKLHHEEIFLDYAKKENEREVRFLGTGKWEDFK